MLPTCGRAHFHNCYKRCGRLDIKFKKRLEGSNAEWGRKLDEPVFPLAALISKVLIGPSILTSFWGARILVLNALPLVCLQSKQ